MIKIAAFSILFTAYSIYTISVYTKGTESSVTISPAEQLSVNKGKALFQQHNCIACHQLYGLGGFLGPELTTAYSDPLRGEAYMRAFLMAGGNRMPNYNFSKNEIDAVISYLKYVDQTAVTYK